MHHSRQISILTLLALSILVSACSSPPIPNRDPVGESFPAVEGTALDDKVWKIPADLAGKPAVLLVGYVQDAQFDLDRWLLGIVQLGTSVPFFELPTIQGMAPRMFKGTIDDGMRDGIPVEDWRGVITLWGEDAERIVALTGNTQPRNGRVLLLDAEGRVAWFTDRGFSAGLMVELDARVRALMAPTPTPSPAADAEVSE